MTLLPAFYTMRQSDPTLFIIASILVQCPYLFLPLSLIAQSKKKKNLLGPQPGGLEAHSLQGTAPKCDLFSSWDPEYTVLSPLPRSLS